jgi:hypothetical protein
MNKKRIIMTHLVVIILLALPTPSLADQTLSPARSYTVDVPSRSTAGGITFDGSVLWISVQSVCDPDRFVKYSLTGELLETIISPREGNPGGGMAFDGTSVYNLNYNTNMNTGLQAIDRFSLQGDFLDSAPAAGGYNTFGLTWNGNGFYQGHSPSVVDKSKIYQLDANRQEQKQTTVDFYVRGLAWDGSSLWVSSGKSGNVYQLNRRLKPVKTYTTTVPLADITWANGSLWGVEANANRLHQFVLP